jgi:hypothetical protein
MPCDKSTLLEFLEVLNEELTKKVTLVAVGGTAMTLLDLKPSTMDIDFTIPSNDLPEFERALKNNPSGFKIDRWSDGQVFCQTLPDDYIHKSIKIRHYTHILLKALHPVDIVVTKIGRLNQRDIQDIETCIRKSKITKEEITARAALVSPTYVSKEEDYLYHLNWIIKKFYQPPRNSPNSTHPK